MIDHFSIKVSDLKKSKDFYKKRCIHWATVCALIQTML